MRRLLWVLGIWCVMLLAGQAEAAEPSVEWMIPDYPPVGIVDAEDQAMGIENRLTDMLISRMPGYQHKTEVGNVSRILEQFKRPEKCVCIAGIIKTPERETFMTFGQIPSVLLTQMSVVIRTGEDERFGAVSGAVSIRAVLENSALKFGIPRKLIGAPKLTAILETYRDRPHVYQQDATQLLDGLIKMLNAGRIDHTIAYPWMVPYITKKLKLEGRFKTLSITEDSTPVMYYPACTKSASGQAVITKIDANIRELRPTEDYRQIVEQWLHPDNVPHYRQLYNDIFLAAPQLP